ncbi:MAG: peptidoglycan DD-metalloendopeptidase family protein [Prevotella sp.]
MRRILTILLVALIAAALPAQTRKTTQKKPVATKTTGKTTARKKTTTKKKTTKATKKSTQPTNASIKGLQKQRADIRRKIQAQEAQLRRNKADVTKRLKDLMLITGDIETHRRSIDSINRDIKGIQGNIDILESQLSTLDLQLKQRRQRYVKAMRYMNRHNTIQDQLMFIFSASSLKQMYRRARFLREYAAYQKAQGEQVKQKQIQIAEKQEQLKAVKGEKNNLLHKGQREHAALQTKQAEQQQMVTKLQKQQKTIQLVIDEQKKKDAALNQKIEEEIAREVERIRQRAEAEAKRKAEAAEAARKKAAEELARKKAEAQRRAEENARRVAEAKAAEEKAKAEAAAALAAKRDKAAKERAEQRAREAEAERIAAERKAAEDKRRADRDLERTKKATEENVGMSANDRMLSGGFEQNKGRLPMPITGSYRIVSHYGQYTVEGLPNIHLDNKGINILGSSGCAARAIYDGEVSAVYGYSGKWFVMVRHGQYISVYCNLSSASVARGQKVSTRQRLGTVGSDNILQFQLRRGTAKLNPEAWLSR